MSRRTTEPEKLWASVISAAVASGITYFLYGTERGDRARRKIGKTARKIRDKTVEMKDDAIEGTNMLYNTAKDSYSNLSALLNEHKSALKNISQDDVEWLAERFKDRMSDVWDDTREDIEEVIDDAKE